MKKQLVILVILVLLFIGSIFTFATLWWSDSPANIILITIDTLRADRLGCYGFPDAGTPNIERLAQNGVLFTHVFAQSPLTLPSHSSILTGTNPTLHGVRGNSFYRLPSSLPTLAKILKSYGYQTAAVVSSAPLSRDKGVDQGFDEYDDVAENDDSWEPGRYLAERKAEETISRALKQYQKFSQQPDKPFFLWIHVFDPHAEYQPPKPFSDRFAHDLYQGEIAYTDACLGKLFEAIIPVQQNTFIVLTADHGEGLGEHGELSHGYFLYNTTLHVPWIIQGPMIAPGQKIGHYARSIDIMPTILGLLDIQNYGMAQGQDLSGLLQPNQHSTKKPSPEMNFTNFPARPSYAETYYSHQAFGWRVLKSLHWGQYKYHATKAGELYDLATDPQEKHNLLIEHPNPEILKIQETCKSALSKYQISMQSAYSQESEQSLHQASGLGYVSGYITLQPEQALQEANAPDPTEMQWAIAKFHEAQTWMELGQDQKATVLFSEIVAQDPGNLMSWALLGKIAVRNQDLTRAIQHYQKLHDLRPQWAMPKKALADVAMQLKDYAQAQRWLQAILDTQGENDAMILSRLAYLKIMANDWSEAIRLAQKATFQDPNLPSAWFYLGLALENQQDYAKAIPAFRAAIRLRSPWPEAQYHYALCLEHHGLKDAAKIAYQKALQDIRPNDPLYVEIQRKLQENAGQKKGF